jgi:hypothetical protein
MELANAKVINTKQTEKLQKLQHYSFVKPNQTRLAIAMCINGI